MNEGAPIKKERGKKEQLEEELQNKEYELRRAQEIVDNAKASIEEIKAELRAL